MKHEEQKLLLNQVRHRILQYVLHNKNVTVKEIRGHLDDVPQASLYRQIKLLSEKGLLVVSGERQVRGTLEHTYALAPELLLEEGEKQTELNIQFTLLSIAEDLNNYYSQNETDPKEDMISLFSSPLFMSDSEFETYLKSVNDLTKQYLNNQPGEGRRSRRVTFVSSPGY